MHVDDVVYRSSWSQFHLDLHVSEDQFYAAFRLVEYQLWLHHGPQQLECAGDDLVDQATPDKYDNADLDTKVTRDKRNDDDLDYQVTRAKHDDELDDQVTSVNS